MVTVSALSSLIHPSVCNEFLSTYRHSIDATIKIVLFSFISYSFKYLHPNLILELFTNGALKLSRNSGSNLVLSNSDISFGYLAEV